MQVILLEKIGKLGNIGDKANVKAGFGRNYLVPQGKAVFATEANIADVEIRRAGLEAAAADKLGKLFGSVGVRELEDAINAAGGEVSKSEINLPTGGFRHVGEFTFDVQLHLDLVQSVTLVIEAE